MPFPSYLHRAPILVNVDTSNDFMRPDGALYVTGAEPLIERLNAFWGELQAGELAYAIGLFDSHIAETYPHTDEAKLFPMLHSVVGTPGWNYAPDINLLNGKCPIGYFLKPVFGIGGGDTGIERSTGKSETSLLIEAQQEGRISEEEIHKMIEIAENYYKLATPAAGTLNGFTFGEHRDSFFGRIHFNVTKTALVTGVATDYCVRHATRYLLEQGFTVVLLTDLVAVSSIRFKTPPDSGT